MSLTTPEITRIEELVALHRALGIEMDILGNLITRDDVLVPNFGRTPETREAAALLRKQGVRYRAIAKHRRDVISAIADCAIYGVTE
jgi:DNA-binding MurR/RpiR family transcriptional regulator